MICIYHGNCFDGWTAAWVVKNNYPDILLHREVYDRPANVPDVKDQDVIIVDYTYKRDIMERILNEAKSLLVLDHHKTAEEALKGMPQENFIFDMKRSGAGIAWDYFHAPMWHRPWLVDYIEDRDIWNKFLPNTDIIHAFIASHKRTMENWDMLAEMPLEEAVEKGRAIHNFMERYIEAVVKEARKTTWMGLDIAVVNCPYLMCSEIGNRLCKEMDVAFSVSWFQNPTGQYNYSLRSIGDFDVSKVAAAFGGGGHKNAAGFTSNTQIENMQTAYNWRSINV